MQIIVQHCSPVGVGWFSCLIAAGKIQKNVFSIPSDPEQSVSADATSLSLCSHPMYSKLDVKFSSASMHQICGQGRCGMVWLTDLYLADVRHELPDIIHQSMVTKTVQGLRSLLQCPRLRQPASISRPTSPSRTALTGPLFQLVLGPPYAFLIILTLSFITWSRPLGP